MNLIEQYDFNEQFWQQLKQHGLSMQDIQLRTALTSINKIYQVYLKGLNDPQQAETSLDYIANIALNSIDQLTKDALASTESIGLMSKATNTLAVIYFHAHAKAYELLIKQDNSDDWLGQFLDTFPEFREDIGGYPNWLKRPE